MRVISINVGQPRTVTWKGQRKTTSIFKGPVEGRVMMRTFNIDGDRQANTTVHGGRTKAVYAYPVEHYEFWKSEFPDVDLPYGMFGENLTTEGLLETELNIGDRLRVGDGEVMVTEPRMPCANLAMKFGREDIVKRFLVSRRSGFYLAVLREGEVGAGDAIELVSRDINGVAVADITEVYASKDRDIDLMKRALNVEALPTSWKNHFKTLIDESA